MTIVELLVSMAVLVIMIVMANMLVVQARRSVRLAEDVIEANADARVVADRIRADLAGITKDGFLVIGTREATFRDPQSGNDVIAKVPFLAFTAVGTFRNTTGQVIGDAAQIDYGFGTVWYDNGTPGDTNDDFIGPPVLCRRAIILNPDINLPHPVDTQQLSLSSYRQRWFKMFLDVGVLQYDPPFYSPRKVINDFWLCYLPELLQSNGGPWPDDRPLRAPEMRLPVRTLQDAGDVWPHLIGDVRSFSIQWTDGARNGRDELMWYGMDSHSPSGEPGAGAPEWTKRAAIIQDVPPLAGENLPEYNMNVSWDRSDANQPDDQDPLYGALWTYRKKDNWPKAIRFRMELGDPPRLYEIIVDLPR